MPLAWGIRNLRRHPLRCALSVLGIAVAGAMLLDMVMLAGSLEGSFARLQLERGYQIRISPKGTLPFDTEATIGDVTTLVARLRADPAVSGAEPVLAASVFTRRGDALVPLTGYGIDPSDQGLYELQAGADLAPADTLGLLLSQPAAAATGAGVGDTVTLVGRLDPQLASAGIERRLVVRGLVRWLYDPEAQASVGTTLRVMQRLAGQAAGDRASAVMVRARDDARADSLAARLARAYPALEVNSLAGLAAQFRARLIYFRQLAAILGTLSLVVTVLLVATLLTVTVTERLGEIATLRALGIGRSRIVRQVLAEGTVLTLLGGVLGVLLGLVTARYLDAILTSFPGLPADFSFFVPHAPALAKAAVVLLGTGALAGLYPAWLAARAPIAATLRAEAM
ncbi:MAG: ABC transporter permease [Gemmatimonadota bacterium]